VQKKRRIALWVCGIVLLLAAGLFGLYGATQYVPEFYRRAIAADPAAQRQSSDQMLQQVTALVSSLKKRGRWEVVFTAEQINGWLAVDMVQNHPEMLPPSLGNPRVAIEPEGMMLACRFRWGFFSSVLSLNVDPYLAEPNGLALRIRKARAGMLPMPLGGILDRLSEAAGHADLRLHWGRSSGDPVALISLPPSRQEDGHVVRIEALQLGKGEIYVAGTTAAGGSRQ
jgi:hypothetical protein